MDYGKNVTDKILFINRYYVLRKPLQNNDFFTSEKNNNIRIHRHVKKYRSIQGQDFGYKLIKKLLNSKHISIPISEM